ncbi:MAG: hypothetical protein WAM56_09045, partial [Acidobacteriaceae bacterium]
FALGVARADIRKYALVAFAMLAYWVPVHYEEARPFLHNPSDTGVHFSSMAVSFLNPFHWPQIASAFGFLAIPIYLNRRYLSRDELYMCAGALPCLVITTLFGIWFETRIWGEWTLLVAALAAKEVTAWCILSGTPETISGHRGRVQDD